MDHKVSIVTPTYNRAPFLEELIQFTLRQTYKNWELVIVDDGSEDETEEILEKAVEKDSRIKFYTRDKKPKGASTCRNIGIKKASGKYIIFLDSDDLLASFALEQRVKYMQENPGLDFSVFYGLKFNSEPGDSHALVNKEIPSGDTALEAFLKRNYPWHTTSPIWRKSSLLENDVYWDEKLGMLQDVDFHIQALLKELNFKINKQAQPDFFWRVQEKNHVSNYKGFPAKYRTCEHYLHKLGTSLKDYGKYDNENRSYLVQNYFAISRIMTMESALGKGLQLWKFGYKKKYIISTEYYVGKMLLHFFNFIFHLIGGKNSKIKNSMRKFYYKIIPAKFEQDKELLIFDQEIKT